MKKRFLFVFICLFTIICFSLSLTSCKTNYDVQANSFQKFNYVYIISDDKYYEIKNWVIGDYGCLKFTDKDNIRYCICQANWILYENIDEVVKNENRD